MISTARLLSVYFVVFRCSLLVVTLVTRVVIAGHATSNIPVVLNIFCSHYMSVRYLQSRCCVNQMHPGKVNRVAAYSSGSAAALTQRKKLCLYPGSRWVLVLPLTLTFAP